MTSRWPARRIASAPAVTPRTSSTLRRTTSTRSARSGRAARVATCRPATTWSCTRATITASACRVPTSQSRSALRTHAPSVIATAPTAGPPTRRRSGGEIGLRRSRRMARSSRPAAMARPEPERLSRFSRQIPQGRRSGGRRPHRSSARTPFPEAATRSYEPSRTPTRSCAPAPSSLRERSSPRSAWRSWRRSSGIRFSRFASTRPAPSPRCRRNRCGRRSGPTSRPRSPSTKALSRTMPTARRPTSRWPSSPSIWGTCRAPRRSTGSLRSSFRRSPERTRTSPISIGGRGRRAEAEETLRRGLAAAPGDAGLHHALGLALVRQKRMPEALVELERAARSSPSAPALRVCPGDRSRLRRADRARDRGAGSRGAEARRESRDPGSTGISFHAKAGHRDAAALYAKKLQDLTGPSPLPQR